MNAASEQLALEAVPNQVPNEASEGVDAAGERSKERSFTIGGD